MPEPILIAHWPLDGHFRDVVGGHHGKETAVSFGQGPAGAGAAAALFNGRDSVIEVPDAKPLRLGNRDFTISLRLRCETPMKGVFGDPLSKFDAAARCGLNLSVAGSSPAYNGMSDTRHVHLGIDDGYLGSWEDCGRPWPSNPLIPCLIVFEGNLYAGLADAQNPMDAAKVFRYAGGQDWIDCGRLGKDPKHLSVQAMIVHRGRLYAGVGVWDWVKALGGVPEFHHAATRVFVYEGGQDWRDLGQVGNGSRVLCLGSFDGELYAGIDRVGGGRCYKYDGRGWIDCGVPDGRNFECFLPLGGTLYASTHGNVYEYRGGQTWDRIGNCPYGINQIHTMQAAFGKIWIGCWPQGYVLRYEGAGEWTNTGRLGIPQGLRECNEINDLTVHNGKLYAGVIPKGQVYRYEADGQWTLLGSLASRPDWDEDNVESWNRVTSLTSFQGKLFACTGACRGRHEDIDPDRTVGRVAAVQTGQMASHESDIGGSWTSLRAVRKDRELRLYVNDRLSAACSAPVGHSFDLTNTRPLLIGAGAQGHFCGALSDLRLYSGVLES